MRELRDADGVEWTVFEVKRASAARDLVPGLMKTGWLCFENGTHKKRIAPIPAGWEELSDAALLALARDVSPQPKRSV
jgi:hypothetical protein